MYHEYVSPNGRLQRRHYNGQRNSQDNSYLSPNSFDYQVQATTSVGQFRKLLGSKSNTYKTFISYYWNDDPESKTYKVINAIFQAAIRAFQVYPKASAEALAYAAGILPDKICTCNGANQDNCLYCAGVAQAVEMGMKP